MKASKRVGDSAIRRSCYGFTLLEVLMATFIISLAMSGLMSIFLVAAKQSNTASNKSGAAFYQKRILDELRYFVIDSPGSYVHPTEPAAGVEIHHTCTCVPGCATNPHFMLEDGNGAGPRLHQLARPGGPPISWMIPATDELVTKFGVIVNGVPGAANVAYYSVDDTATGGKNIRAEIPLVETGI